MIIYDRLWETMKEKGMTQYRLIKYYGFSAGQLGRLKRNAYVSTHTIDVLCTILNCSAEDVLEFRLDETLNPRLGIDPSVAVDPPKKPIKKQRGAKSTRSIFILFFWKIISQWMDDLSFFHFFHRIQDREKEGSIA